MNSHSLPGDKLGDYCDGELFLSSELFQEDPCALQIQLYYDELEVGNPIGSKAKKHKLGKGCVYGNLVMSFNAHYHFFLGLVYYLLGNLEPRLRSSLKSIQLLCVVKNDIVVKYGIEAILKPIVESIQALEQVILTNQGSVKLLLAVCISTVSLTSPQLPFFLTGGWSCLPF